MSHCVVCWCLLPGMLLLLRPLECFDKSTSQPRFRQLCSACVMPCLLQLIEGFGAISGGTWDELEGESFYFRVNGLPIFMKGANLIPFNILPTNVTAATIRQQLSAALEANMNMIRIW